MPVRGPYNEPCDDTPPPPRSSFRTGGLIPVVAGKLHVAKDSGLAQGETHFPGQPLSNDWSYKGYKYSVLLPQPGTTLQGYLSFGAPHGVSHNHC